MLGNVLNGFHLSYAALRVLMNESQGKLKTKQNNDTEFKYYLSFSCKISECVRQYTPTSSSRQIGIVTCHSGDINQFNHIISKVSGTKISEESFASSTYLTAEKEQSIKSSFKISPTEAGSLESIIISKIAVKDIWFNVNGLSTCAFLLTNNNQRIKEL